MPSVALQLLQSDCFTPCKRVPLAHYHRQVGIEKRVRVDVVEPMAMRFESKHEVNLAPLQSVHEFFHGQINNIEFHLGILPGKKQQSFGENGAKRIGYANA